MPTMSEPERIGDLEIHQDLPHERREWVIERIGWVLMGLLLLAAFIGLLGPGPLSSATAGESGSILWAEYDRFERSQAPSTLRVHVGPGASRDGKARLWLNRDFIDNVEIHLIEPQPEMVEAGPDRFVYTFNTPGSEQATAVTFHFEANRFWRIPVRIGLEGGPELQFSQFIYP